MTEKRLFLTGATGFIGKHLIRRLINNGEVVSVLVRDPAKLNLPQHELSSIRIFKYDGEYESIERALKESAPDAVFHLASHFVAQHTTADISKLVSSNVLFGAQLLEAMVDSGVNALINTGTSWQHYQNRTGTSTNLYAATKQAFESFIDYYVDAKGLSAVSLLLFDTYGLDDTRSKIVSLLWKTAISGTRLDMSAGEQLIDLVHVEDVVDAFLISSALVMEGKRGHLRYGVSSGRPMPLKELTIEFEKHTGYKLPITWGGRPYREREVMVPWNTYESVPGWTPKVAFADGILQVMPQLT